MSSAILSLVIPTRTVFAAHALNSLAKQLPEIAADVRASVERGNLLSEVVVGEGTEARSIIDGLAAVNRQLRQDILPKVCPTFPIDLFGCFLICRVVGTNDQPSYWYWSHT